MKILILSDIHSNWAALRAVVEQEKFDACLCAGDIVDYGADPLPCLEWIRANSVICVRGNHDHAVAQRIRPTGGAGLRALTASVRPLHWELLADSDLEWLARLPVSRFVELDGKRFHLLHATPRDPLDEYLGPQAEGWRDRLSGIDADFLCAGHTHQPYVLQIGRSTIVNPGSVGQPRDGDPRAAYAVYENGEIELRRVKYDIDEAVRQMASLHVAEDVIKIAERSWSQGGLFAEGSP